MLFFKKKSSKELIIWIIWQDEDIQWLLSVEVLDSKTVKILDTQLCPTLCDPMNCRPPGSIVHGILQARLLEWVAIPFPRGSFQPRHQTQVSCIAGRFFTIWATGDLGSIPGLGRYNQINPFWGWTKWVARWLNTLAFPHNLFISLGLWLWSHV